MYNKLQQDMITAMKNKDTMRRDVVRGVIAAIKKAAIDERCEITEDLVNKVLLKEHKTIVEQSDTCPEERQELMLEYTSRLVVLNEYVPQLITDEEEIFAIIHGELAAAGIEMTKANRGVIMKTVMPILKGKVDMKIANKVIGDNLS